MLANLLRHSILAISVSEFCTRAVMGWKNESREKEVNGAEKLKMHQSAKRAKDSRVESINHFL